MSWWSKSRSFLSETRAEMKKVTFPARDEVVSTTVVVLITSFIFAVYLYFADLVIVNVYDFILGLFAS